jgi:hypothetical protein
VWELDEVRREQEDLESGSDENENEKGESSKKEEDPE